VSYSLLLLNTDLHVAELATRMSRNQFVRNTLTAIQMQLHPASDVNHDDGGSVRGAGPDGQETISMGRSKRSGSITSWKSISRDTVMSSSGVSLPTGSASQVSSITHGEQPSRNGSSNSVYELKPQNSSASSVVYNRGWENDMENMLKVFIIDSRYRTI
jgi:PH/SEC7 domain-containing protein